MIQKKQHKIVATRFLKERFLKIYEFLEKENAPRYSAGQLNIVESKSANHQTLQQKGNLHGIKSRE